MGDALLGVELMVGAMLLHMTQVFLWALTSILAKLRGCLVSSSWCARWGLAFTGQVLRWDEDAYWGLGSAQPFLGVPLIGEGAVNVMLGVRSLPRKRSPLLFAACLHPSGNCPGASGYPPPNGADQGDQ